MGARLYLRMVNRKKLNYFELKRTLRNVKLLSEIGYAMLLNVFMPQSVVRRCAGPRYRTQAGGAPVVFLRKIVTIFLEKFKNDVLIVRGPPLVSSSRPP